jgi:hypothetical protein
MDGFFKIFSFSKRPVFVDNFTIRSSAGPQTLMGKILFFDLNLHINNYLPKLVVN